MKDSLFYLVRQLLLLNEISIDKKELKFQIQSHPSYPSLHAVTGVLDHFYVDNLALNVPKNLETLIQLPRVFLAQIVYEQKEVFVVIINKDKYYEAIVSNNKKLRLTTKEFLDIFTGVIVAVERTNLIDETKPSLSIFNNLIAITFIALLSYLLVNSGLSIINGLFSIAALLGLFISIAIKKQELGLQTVLGNTFCSGESKTKDCDAVLSSKGANILGQYKLSDISIIYFAALSLSVLSFTLLRIDTTILFTISIISASITLFSIYYQAIIVKKWCLLCLCIVAVLWFQTGISIFSLNNLTTFNVSSISILYTALNFTLALVIWNIISPQHNLFNELKQIKVDHFRFKRNFNLFNTLLKSSKKVDTSIDDSLEITFGNPNANLEITVVTSPFCGHCKPVHDTLEKILEKYSNLVKINIRFNTNTEAPENALTKIASKLIDIYQATGEKDCLTAMHDIYNNNNLETWLKTYSATRNTITFKTLKKQHTWCKTNGYNFTPVVLINGNIYPKEYDRTDLIYFIEDLQEHYQKPDYNVPITT